MSDDTEPENYRLSDNQTPDLFHCRHNNKTQKTTGNYKDLQEKAVANCCNAPKL